jgi:hypothetical protein
VAEWMSGRDGDVCRLAKHTVKQKLNVLLTELLSSLP